MSEKVYYGKDSIKPDFLTDEEYDEESAVYKQSQSAKEDLKNLEKSAEEESPNEESSASEREKSFKYTGGKSLLSKNSTSKHGKLGAGALNGLKKKSPAFIITGGALIGIIFAFLFVGSLGNQIETLITRATDTMFGSYTENSLRITEELLAGKRGNLPSYLKERFNAQGITVAGSKDTGFSLIFEDKTITSSNFKTTYNENIAFREAFTKAKRGRTSNFFDASATFTFTRLGLSRNIYRNYKSGNKTEYDKIRNSRFDNTTTSTINTVSERQAIDEDGNPRFDDSGNPIMEKISNENIRNTADAGADPKVRANNFLFNAAGRAADTASLGCSALKVANLISISIAAAQIYQAINYFMGDIENVSKTKAGYGNAADQNYFLNFLNEPVTTTYIDIDTGEEREVSGAPIEAEGFANILTGAKPDTSKTRNYSIESAFITSGLAIGTSVANQRICGGLRATSAVISIAVGLIGGGIVNTIATIAKTTVFNVALQAGITGMLSVLIPKIASTLFENTAEKLAGIPAGETFVEGAALANKKVARGTSGQMLASKSIATAYANTTAIANNYEAEIERNNKSPFDISNPDTFFGSIAGKLASITTSNSLFSNIRAFSALTTNSTNSLLSSLSSKTFADGENTTASLEVDYSTVFGDKKTCQNLTSIGAACDMYGVEITATDPAVMKVSTDDPKYQAVLAQNVRKDASGRYQVIPNSLLANKLMFCDERDSPFGVYDANIANAFNTSLGFGDNIPILNDVVDLVNSIEDMSPESEGWATGAYCVMNKETNPHYEELVYLQHYTEDMRIATQMKLDEVTDENNNTVNPTTAYKEDYYEVNPIDTSEAGLFARYTGATKKEAEELIALIDYYQYLAEYEPPVEEKDTDFNFKSNSTFDELSAILLNKAEYFDLRNRSFAA